MGIRSEFISQTSASDSGPSLSGLVDVLGRAGKVTKTIKMPDGTAILVLLYGGRLLGLFSPESEENFYWTNTVLNSVESAENFFNSEKWQNTGGDRTWLAPEVDLFFPNFPKLDKFVQQRSLDPGKYGIEDTPQGLQFVNPLTVNFSRTKENVSLRISKRVGPAKNPLRCERELDLGDVQYAGYTQYTSLELVGDSRNTNEQVGLWNLVQMPHGGDLLVPTFGLAKPRHIFSTIGTIPPEDLIANDNLVRYRMRQVGEHKISVPAVSVTGRLGYLYQTGDKWALIIRNFTVNPSGEYVDVPWTDAQYFGYAAQACNVNSGLGKFSELEYHIPAIGRDTGAIRCDDRAEIWAFRGTKDQISVVSRTLLTSQPWLPREA